MTRGGEKKQGEKMFIFYLYKKVRVYEEMG
jgi:hypothetical protein